MEFKVAVICLTYNHSKYIRQTLDGFAAQQTEFPFVCGIIDDASTDGARDILLRYAEQNLDLTEEGTAKIEDTEYAHVIYARHRSNHNCFFAILLLRQNHHSTGKRKLVYLSEWRENAAYEALCEGDDYWTSTCKLQRQVSFMDAHEEYSYCFHEEQVLENDELQPVNFRYKSHCDVPIGDIITQGGLFVPTASILFRRSFQPFPKEVYRQHVGDYPIQIYLASVGKVRYFHDVMCVYRHNSAGSWSESVSLSSAESKERRHKMETRLLNEMNELTGYRFDRYFRRRMHIQNFFFYKKSNKFKAAWHLIRTARPWRYREFDFSSRLKQIITKRPTHPVGR